MKCKKEEKGTAFRVREVVFAKERAQRFEKGTLGQTCESDARGSFLNKHSRLTRLSEASPQSAFFRIQ